MAWKLLSRRRTAKPSRSTYFKPRLEALEDRTLLDGNGLGFSLPLGMNQVAPTPLRDLTSNAYWQAVSAPLTHSNYWLTALSPSLNKSIHFSGDEFGGVVIKSQYLQGQYGVQVKYEDKFVVPDILDQGSTTAVDISGSETIGNPNSLNVTTTANFTDPNFLGTGMLFTVNSSSNTQYQGKLIIGWSGQGALSGSSLIFPGDTVQLNVGLSQPQSMGPANITWTTDNTYSAPNVMTPGDILKSHLWGNGYIDSNSNVFAENFQGTFLYQGSNFYAQGDQVSASANFSIDQSGTFNGGVTFSYAGPHIFSSNDYFVFLLSIGTPPANWNPPVMIGVGYSLFNNPGINVQLYGTFGSNNPYGSVPPPWSFGLFSSGNGYKATIQVNPQGGVIEFGAQF